MCLARFPNARICGDDWDYPPVARAATDAAAPLGLKIHAEEGKCWAYYAEESPFSAAGLAAARAEFLGEEVSAQAHGLFRSAERVLSQADDADALFGLLDEPYLDQGGQRARLVNTGFPPKGGRPLLSVTCSVASDRAFPLQGGRC